MKKLFVTVLIIFIFGIVLILIHKNSSNTIITRPLLPDTSPAAYENNTFINFAGRIYRIYFQEIDPKSLTLIPNFSQKINSFEIFKINNCRYGTNAGFYTQDNQPLGLFYTPSSPLYTRVVNSALLNGFFYKTTDNQIDITDQSQISTNTEFIFQTGPYFLNQSKLNINNDESARRILIGKTADLKFVFIAVTEKDNIYSGPLLSDLPSILNQLNNYSFEEFLNLDGGAASAFYNIQNEKLEELTPVGAFLCGK